MVVGRLPPTLPVNTTDPPVLILAGVGLVVSVQLAAWALGTPNTTSVHIISPAEIVDRNRCFRDISIFPKLLYDIPVEYNCLRL